MGEDEGRPPILRLIIANVRPMRALDIGAVVESLAEAHGAFQEDSAVPAGAKCELRMTGLYQGSLVLEFSAVFLAAAGVAFQFEECRQMMRNFVSALRGDAKIMAGEEVGNPSNANRKLIKAGSALVDGGDALSIRIDIHGDNDDPFELGQAAAAAILRKAREQRKPSGAQP